jgi:hypothetical protein
MALKPNAHTCRIREQTVEDLPSGLTLHFQARGGDGARLVIAGKLLPRGSHEIVFDTEGRTVRVGPVQLKKLPR